MSWSDRQSERLQKYCGLPSTKIGTINPSARFERPPVNWLRLDRRCSARHAIRLVASFFVVAALLLTGGTPLADQGLNKHRLASQLTASELAKLGTLSAHATGQCWCTRTCAAHVELFSSRNDPLVHPVIVSVPFADVFEILTIAKPHHEFCQPRRGRDVLMSTLRLAL